MLHTRRLCLVLCSLHVIGLCTVSGISMTVNPATVLLGSTAPSKTVFRCDGISENDIQSSIRMTMAKFDSFGTSKQAALLELQNTGTRVKEPVSPEYYAVPLTDNQNEPTCIAQVSEAIPNEVFATANLAGTSFNTDTAPTTMRNRQTPPDLNGGIDQNTPDLTFFSVSFETNEMTCNDAGTYECSYSYIGTDNDLHTIKDQKNLSISANPYDMILTASKAGMMGVSLGGTINSPFAMKVNESISFTCHGKIGSEKGTLIRWEMSSLTSENSDVFMRYTPTIGEDGLPNMTPEDCSYSRTATMTYRTILADAGRKNYLAFKCYAGLGQNRADSKTFYIEVEGSGSGGTGGIGASSGGDDAGAIAGGVVGAVVAIVIIVLLVYFLWYRRRSGGDTYRTKEESGPDNPNMAPSTDDLYAKPVKDKNRDSNDKHGMDEDYNYRDADDYNRGRSRGRENRALDTDSYNSRDGSPTMHMGGGHIGTGV